jgi:RNA-directed DNA polymerase
VDRVTLAYAENEYGVSRMLGELQRDLRAGTYRLAPARRVEIPKPQGGKRPLGIPAVRDRVAQQAAGLVLEPIFEADFALCSYGFRPGRSATQAMERLQADFIGGCQFVAESVSTTSSARSAMTGCSPRWGSGYRTGGCSSWSACGCRQG